MEITHSVENGFTILALNGRLDELAAHEAQVQFAEAVPASEPKVLLDLSGVEYISSGGLRVVLMLLKAVKRSGGVLRVCGLSPFVAEVFMVSNLLPMFEVYPARAQALATS